MTIMTQWVNFFSILTGNESKKESSIQCWQGQRNNMTTGKTGFFYFSSFAGQFGYTDEKP